MNDRLTSQRLHLVVTYNDHTIMYYPIGAGQGWKIDNPSRCVIVGRGIPRTYIPLDQVRSFQIEQIEPPKPAGPACFKCGRTDGVIVNCSGPEEFARYMHAYGKCDTNGLMT